MDALLVSQEDAALAVGLGLTSFKQLVRAGKIATVKIGARRLVSRRALDEFVKVLEAEAEGNLSHVR